MLKKSIAFCICIVCLGMFTGYLFQKTSTGEYILLGTKFSVADILSENSNYREMCSQALEEVRTYYDKMLPGNPITIAIAPLPDNKPKGHIRWENDYGNPRITLYEKNGIICDYDASVRSVLYLSGREPFMFEYEKYLKDTLRIDGLRKTDSEYERGMMSLLSCNTILTAADQHSLDEYRVQISPHEYLELQSYGHAYFSLVGLVAYKHATLEKVGKIIIEGRDTTKKFHSMFRKDTAHWPLAFYSYHYQKHWKKYAIRHFIILCLLAVLIDFFFSSLTQLLRKDAKLIFSDELKKRGVTPTPALLRQFFRSHLGFLFVQPKDIVVQKYCEKIVSDILGKNIARRAQEIWKAFENIELEEVMKKTLQGHVRIAMSSSEKLEKRELNLEILENNQWRLSHQSQIDFFPSLTTNAFQKRHQGENEKEKLRKHVNMLVDLNLDMVQKASTNELRNIILACEVLPVIGGWAMDIFVENADKLIRDKEFVNSLRTEDREILLQRLKRHVRDEPKVQSTLARDESTFPLLHKSVIVCGGNKVDRHAHKLCHWVEDLGAEKTRYISGKKMRELHDACKQTNTLVIMVRPLNHSTQSLVFRWADGRFLWANHYSERFFKEEIRKHANHFLAA